MSFFTPQRNTFNSSGKQKIQIIVEEIDQYDEEPYKIAAGVYSEVDGVIDAGYSTTIWGQTTSYYRNEQKVKVKQLRICLKINSNPVRLQLERGIFGGGVFKSEEFLEIEINVEPWCVKDIVEELRRDRKRGFRVDGYAISDKVFRVAYFLLFEKNRV